MTYRRPLNERMKDLESRHIDRYDELRLRADLSTLIEKGLDRKDINQAELARRAKKRESYISRLVNAATSCKMSIVAQVLAPLGIRPKLVDAAEWESLRAFKRRAESAPVPQPIVQEAQHAIAKTIGTGDGRFSIQIQINERLTFAAEIGRIAGRSAVVESVGASGHPDTVGTTRQILASSGCEDSTIVVGVPCAVSTHAGVVERGSWQRSDASSDAD